MPEEPIVPPEEKPKVEHHVPPTLSTKFIPLGPYKALEGLLQRVRDAGNGKHYVIDKATVHCVHDVLRHQNTLEPSQHLAIANFLSTLLLADYKLHKHAKEIAAIVAWHLNQGGEPPATAVDDVNKVFPPTES